MTNTKFSYRAKLFRGLSDPSRLSILEALRAGPLSVGKIVAATGLTQSNASTHLRCLSECGLVTAQPNGRFVHYQLSDPAIEQLFTLSDKLLAGVAVRILACANYNVPGIEPIPKSEIVRSTPRPARANSRAHKESKSGEVKGV